MFIRRTKTRSVKGKDYYSYRLVQSERIDGKVRPKTLLNLGANFGVPQEQWGAVTQLAESLLQGQSALFSTDPEVQAAARDLVSGLRARGFSRGELTAEQDAIATVDLDTLGHEDARSVGCERLCLHALEELGLPSLLGKLGVSERDARIALALVIAKMAHPSSEREALRWLQDDSAIRELLSLNQGPVLSLSKLYRTNDLLWRHREALESGLFRQERQLLGLADTLVFHDLSNAYYTGRAHGALLRFGRSRQKRNDCPLVTLALLLDESGFPRSCEMLPGNVSEPATLEDAMRRLELRCNDKKPTVIMDAGIASEENSTWLAKQGYDWLCVSREAKPAPPEGEADLTVTTQAQYQVQAWNLDNGHDEARLYVVSEGKKLTGESILTAHRQKIETALTALHQGLSKPGYTKRYDKVLERVGRIREKYAKVSNQYDIQVTAGEKGQAAAVRFTHLPRHADADAAAGACVLRTSHRDWDVEKLLRTYWRLTEIEATFRSLKTELRLRPIWHSKDSRIAAHLFIGVLAYHGVHLIRTRLRARGITLSWEFIRHRLCTWVRITTTVREVSGRLIVNRQDVRPSAEVAQLAAAAGVKPQIHRRRQRQLE